jgi:hypothetical protein
MTPDFANTPFQVAQIVTECWREVLGLAVVDPRRNFFELGGTSLQAILLHTRLRERLPACDFSVMEIFKHPTIAGFLEAIAPLLREPASLDGRRAAPVAPGISARERAEQQQRTAAIGPPWAIGRS